MIKYSLSQLLEILNRWQKTLFAGFDFYFTAELHKPKIINNYIYAELIELEKNSDEWFDSQHNNTQNIKAKIKWIIFDHSIVDKFQKNSWKTLNEMEWLTLLMKGNFSFHQQYGTSIVISHISDTYTVWQIQQQKAQILNKLQKEWIINKNKSLTTHFPPYKIAIITWQKSEWANDFTSILDQSQFSFSYQNFFSKIHGNQAIPEILSQLEHIKQLQINWANFSHIIITRWGGESSGMMWANDENIARAICMTDIPVIIALWHTTDSSVLDSIVHTVAKTPSDAAYILINSYEEYRHMLLNIKFSINQNIKLFLEEYKQKIVLLKTTISNNCQNAIQETKKLLQLYMQSIQSHSPQRLTEKGYAIIKHGKQILKKSDIKPLKKNDQLTIDIYGYSITVSIIESKKNKAIY